MNMLQRIIERISKNGDMKKAVATLLRWENEEEPESESESEDEGGERGEAKKEGEEEENEGSVEENEGNESSTSSDFAELQERYGIDGEGANGERPALVKSGKYILRAIVGRDSDGLWAVLRRDGLWVSRNGLISRDNKNARLEGMRLEFWDRL